MARPTNDGDKIYGYSLKFSVEKDKIYIEEDVDAVDTRSKGKFLIAIQDEGITDKIYELIEKFNERTY